MRLGDENDWTYVEVTSIQTRVGGIGSNRQWTIELELWSSSNLTVVCNDARLDGIELSQICQTS
jgi:hypothetical protein